MDKTLADRESAAEKDSDMLINNRLSFKASITSIPRQTECLVSLLHGKRLTALKRTFITLCKSLVHTLLEF